MERLEQEEEKKAAAEAEEIKINDASAAEDAGTRWKNKFIKIYKREEYDMLSYLGDMGGLLDIIIFVGIGLSSSIVARLF